MDYPITRKQAPIIMPKPERREQLFLPSGHVISLGDFTALAEWDLPGMDRLILVRAATDTQKKTLHSIVGALHPPSSRLVALFLFDTRRSGLATLTIRNWSKWSGSAAYTSPTRNDLLEVTDIGRPFGFRFSGGLTNEERGAMLWLLQWLGISVISVMDREEPGSQNLSDFLRIPVCVPDRGFDHAATKIQNEGFAALVSELLSIAPVGFHVDDTLQTIAREKSLFVLERAKDCVHDLAPALGTIREIPGGAISIERSVGFKLDSRFIGLGSKSEGRKFSFVLDMDETRDVPIAASWQADDGPERVDATRPLALLEMFELAGFFVPESRRLKWYDQRLLAPDRGPLLTTGIYESFEQPNPVLWSQDEFVAWLETVVES